MSGEAAHAAVRLLLAAIPESGKADAARMVLETVRAAHEKHGQPTPGWIEQLL